VDDLEKSSLQNYLRFIYFYFSKFNSKKLFLLIYKLYKCVSTLNKYYFLKEKYDLTLQTITIFLDDLPNYQGLHSNPQTTKTFEKYNF